MTGVVFLFRIAVADPFIGSHVDISTLLGDLRVGATPFLELVIVLADSGVLLPLPSAINTFVFEIWLFFVLQGG